MKMEWILLVWSDFGAKWSDVLWYRAKFKQCGAMFYGVARNSSNVGRYFMVSREVQAKWSDFLWCRAKFKLSGAIFYGFARIKALAHWLELDFIHHLMNMRLY